ncbi:hypothetical protein CpsigB_08195 [Corynebacterium pseudotuberculosis]|uniref:Uncharacterized protein n=1 Tax=Corynebacterium pseudotuberculosis (strain C231) TaxID=681645 RepID=D9QA90_CORP2|nr:hypothetical protein CPC231_04990 [Corynebacterium pseudotuberculosis C231]ADL20872.1 hypothetical protein CP1002_08155 [Corynebacterium pseudotuberculosis 1002]ADO26261.1 hypothetical protein CPI19_06530 [Corynebacterium pseudotuberculosis I19]AEK92321.1 Hypothetical protein CpPAT10_0987 [Corynebacterium pseudotuberculosis PAT10]AEP70237.1 Hypothetical protein Cp4202_0981 [Corynebacterium pseudotuberculosis 42/02-A]AFF22145.1 Hypothetical protein CpP54B96_1006 [Corynebacterium pseudotuberc
MFSLTPATRHRTRCRRPPNTIGVLPIAVTRDYDYEVGYLPGLTMRKSADLLRKQTSATCSSPLILPAQYPYSYVLLTETAK